jgi:hypothetical protein
VKTILVSFAKGKGRPNRFVWRETTKEYPKIRPKQAMLPSPDFKGKEKIMDKDKVKIIDDEPEDGCFVDSSAERRPIMAKKTEIERHPANECAICGKTLEQTGGRRLLIPRVWTKKEIKAGGGEMQILKDMHEGKRPAEIITKGYGLKKEGHKQMEANIQANKTKGLIPWTCQRCAGRTCRACGEPLVCPPISDILDDDGNVSHGPWFGAYAGCINPKCSNYKKSSSAKT